jgi:hypothetical protein
METGSTGACRGLEYYPFIEGLVASSFLLLHLKTIPVGSMTSCTYADMLTLRHFAHIAGPGDAEHHDGGQEIMRQIDEQILRDQNLQQI